MERMVKPEQGWSKGAVSSGRGEMGRRDGEEAWEGRMGAEGRRREKEEGRGRGEEGGGGGVAGMSTLGEGSKLREVLRAP